jgi:dTDP-glucose pyrophosphorylase/CBS domain-containing protein
MTMNIDTVKLFLIEQDAPIKQAMLQLTQEGIKTIFVMDASQRLIGTLTDGDIRRGILSGIELTTKITKIMKNTFFSVNINDKNLKQKAKEIMQKHHIEHVPVIDADRKLMNILSWHEFIVLESSEKKHTSLHNPVVIMAGGKGVRLDPFTKIIPKPLIPLGEKPMVEVIMDRFYERGFNKFKLVINHKKEMIKLYFKENCLPYEIELIEENDFCGTVGGLYLLKEKIKSTFILSNCDTLLEGDYEEILNWHTENKNLLTIIGSHKEVNVPYGVLNMVKGTLIEMIEKPNFDLFVNTGTYIIEPEVLCSISDNEKMDIDQLIVKLMSIDRSKVGVFPCWNRWLDIGQWEEYKNTLKQMGIEN